MAGFMFWLGHRCLSSHALKISYHRPTRSATHRQARRSRNHHRNGQSSRSGSRAPQVNDGLAVPASVHRHLHILRYIMVYTPTYQSVSPKSSSSNKQKIAEKGTVASAIPLSCRCRREGPQTITAGIKMDGIKTHGGDGKRDALSCL